MKPIEISAVVSSIADGKRPVVCIKQQGKSWVPSVRCTSGQRLVIQNQKHYSASFNDLVDVLDTGRGEYRVEFERNEDDFQQQ